jgi:hypothetical protein
LDDFNFDKESLIYRLVSPSNGTLTKSPKETTLHWKARLAEFEREVKNAKDKKSRYKPKVESVTIKNSHGGGSYQTYKIEYKASELSFAAYLELHQGTGTRGYVSLVSTAADELNSVFKEGTCVPDSYLAL